MKINKKAIVSVLLVCTILLSACSEKETKKHSKRKDKKTSKPTLIVDEYSLEDIEEKTNASDLVETCYYSSDCYMVQSSNKYNNVRFMVFDSNKEAREFYEDAVDEYLTSTSYSDDKYSIGWEYGVCDASILDMILVDKNIVLVAELEFWGDEAYIEGEDYEPCGKVYLDDNDIAKIVEEWS
ncbi:MAG: hypothetical protein MJ093_03160 [Saccharofermentans sp.]|nr:hypothetical protein [Saccharofermentans sp.]